MNEWDHVHAELTAPLDYGGPHSYVEVARFVNGCATVEDWGCGGGKMREFITTSYLGVDGSVSPFADVIADLAHYRSQCDAVILRHVLEHNFGWREILEHAIDAARHKVAVVLFTPTTSEGEGGTRNLWSMHDYGDVPNIAFVLDDLLEAFGERWRIDVTYLQSPNTYFGIETCLFATRRAR